MVPDCPFQCWRCCCRYPQSCRMAFTSYTLLATCTYHLVGGRNLSPFRAGGSDFTRNIGQLNDSFHCYSHDLLANNDPRLCNCDSCMYVSLCTQGPGDSPTFYPTSKPSHGTTYCRFS